MYLIAQRRNVGDPTSKEKLPPATLQGLLARYCTLQFLLRSVSAVGAHYSPVPNPTLLEKWKFSKFAKSYNIVTYVGSSRMFSHP